MDGTGYLAYETGWANDGPFHGELAPMQEAGIADKAQPQALRANYMPQMQQPHARGQGMSMPALMGAHARPMQPRARMQQKWVGSPQKFLPPDGDYPGGSTGIPLDGYLAYETGWANDGPFHGELAPMQVAHASALCPHASPASSPPPFLSAFSLRRLAHALRFERVRGEGIYSKGGVAGRSEGHGGCKTRWKMDMEGGDVKHATGACKCGFEIDSSGLLLLQEAGIADKAPHPQSLRALPQPSKLVHARAAKKMYSKPRGQHVTKKSMLAARKALLGDDMFGADYDERVPAKAVDGDLFARSQTKSATLDAMDALV